MNKFCDMFLCSILHNDHYFMVAFSTIKYRITYYNSMDSIENLSRKYTQIVVCFKLTFVNNSFTRAIDASQCKFPSQAEEVKKNLSLRVWKRLTSTMIRNSTNSKQTISKPMFMIVHLRHPLCWLLLRAGPSISLSPT